MKRDAVELRRAHGADESQTGQARQRPVVDTDALSFPTHTLFEQ